MNEEIVIKKKKKARRPCKFQIKPSYIPEGEPDCNYNGKHFHSWLPLEVERWAKRRRTRCEKLKMVEIRQELVRTIWLYGGAWNDNDSWPMTSQRLQVIVNAHRETIGLALHQLWALGWIDIKNIVYSNGKNAGQVIIPRDTKENRKGIFFNKVDKNQTTEKISDVGDSPTEKEKNLRRLAAVFKHSKEALKRSKESPQSRKKLQDWGKEALELLRRKTGNKDLRVSHAVANRFITAWEVGVDPLQAVEELEEKHWTCPVITKKNKEKIDEEIVTVLEIFGEREKAREEELQHVSYQFRNVSDSDPRKKFVVVNYKNSIAGILHPGEVNFCHFRTVDGEHGGTLKELTLRMLAVRFPEAKRVLSDPEPSKFLLQIVAHRENIPFGTDQKTRALEWVQKHPAEASGILCFENIRRWRGQEAWVSLGLWGDGANTERVLISSRTPYVTLPTLEYQMSHSDIPEDAPLACRFSGKKDDGYNLFVTVEKWRSIPGDRRSNGRKRLTSSSQLPS